MKRTLVNLAVGALLASSAAAFAQTAAAPKSDWSLTGNAGLFSDYRFRGFTQTGYSFAYQGGFDLAHSSGFYVGNWNSNVEQGLYNGASLEMDFYGGYKASIGEIGLDVGYLYYYYPKSGALGLIKIDNGELYAGASYGPVSAKVFYSTTNFFGLGKNTPTDSKGSYYLDLTGNFPLAEGLTLSAHYGYQKIKNGKALGLRKDTVSDYRVGITKDFSGWAVGLNVVGTTEKQLFTTAESGFTEGAGKTGAVLSVSKTF
ncbi:TorF family putative porin [Piscinibacterium candidicorallinum]|uniref:TorF family putative porin n=1 Tax=Piscinibacterium candidicorallinum TaxID=1793872 RepID=A0ABV7HBD6_9BURK